MTRAPVLVSYFFFSGIHTQSSSLLRDIFNNFLLLQSRVKMWFIGGAEKFPLQIDEDPMSLKT